MSRKSKKTYFLILFAVLTVLCWCPIGYGSYGNVSMIFGMPSWAFFLLVIGVVMFAIEWFYLFQTNLALYDDDLDRITDELKSLNLENIKL